MLYFAMSRRFGSGGLVSGKSSVDAWLRYIDLYDIEPDMILTEKDVERAERRAEKASHPISKY